MSSGHEPRAGSAGSGVTAGNLEVRQPCEMKMIQKRGVISKMCFLCLETVQRRDPALVLMFAVKLCRFRRTCYFHKSPIDGDDSDAHKAGHNFHSVPSLFFLTLLFFLSFFSRNLKKNGL